MDEIIFSVHRQISDHLISDSFCNKYIKFCHFNIEYLIFDILAFLFSFFFPQTGQGERRTGSWGGSDICDPFSARKREGADYNAGANRVSTPAERSVLPPTAAAAHLGKGLLPTSLTSRNEYDLIWTWTSVSTVGMFWFCHICLNLDVH